jgi:O-6-methylguanine DNA methyltransferase
MDSITPEERHIVSQLQALGEIYPPTSLIGAVMTSIDLADRYFQMPTTVGETFIAFNGRGVSAVEKARDRSAFEQSFKSHFKRAVYWADEAPASLINQIQERLKGARRQGPQFDLSGITEFERAVLFKALEIPYGQVRPYGWIAREIGRPKAVRAVGTALANNPIPLLIPCHRVVRSDGIIGNYGLGGPVVKRRILSEEGVDPGELEQLAHKHVRYVGSDTTHIFCFPTCGHARRVTERHKVTFTSEDQATQLGYRPCKVCRPAGVAAG